LTFRGYEVILFGIRAFFDLHLDWAMMQINIENAFNNVFQVAILESCVMLGGFW